MMTVPLNIALVLLLLLLLPLMRVDDDVDVDDVRVGGWNDVIRRGPAKRRDSKPSRV